MEDRDSKRNSRKPGSGKGGHKTSIAIINVTIINQYVCCVTIQQNWINLCVCVCVCARAHTHTHLGMFYRAHMCFIWNRQSSPLNANCFIQSWFRRWQAFWDVALCSLVEEYRRVGGAYCLNHSSPWWWRQYPRLKCRSTFTRLHNATSQKAVIFILAAVRTWISQQ
jgi:hypothetical protein